MVQNPANLSHPKLGSLHAFHFSCPGIFSGSPYPLAFRCGINVKKLAFLCWDNEMFVSKSAIKNKQTNKKPKHVLAWNPENSRPQKQTGWSSPVSAIKYLFSIPALIGDQSLLQAEQEQINPCCLLAEPWSALVALVIKICSRGEEIGKS